MSYSFRIMSCGNIDAYSNQFKYAGEICGICEQRGADNFYWPNTKSKWVHAKCFDILDPLTIDLTNNIDSIFKNEINYNKQTTAYILAIREIQQHCAPHSILDFLEKNGTEKAFKLFSAIGVETAKKYAETLQFNKKHGDILGLCKSKL